MRGNGRSSCACSSCSHTAYATCTTLTTCTARASCAISVRLNGFDPDTLTRFDYGDGGHEYKLRGVTMCYATPDGDRWEVEYVGPR